jgi:hypothetical protein
LTRNNLLVAVLLALTASCSSDLGALEVYLNRSPEDTENPWDTSLVTHIRIRVTGPGMNPVEEVYPFEAGGSSNVPGIKTGKDRVITVEGLAGEDGFIISRGRSLPLEIREGHQEVELFVARVGRFSVTPGYGLSQSRFAHSAVLAQSGELFVIGGAAGGTIEAPEALLSSIEIYDPTSGKVAYQACDLDSVGLCLAHPRASAAIAPIEDGALLMGGIGLDGLVGQVEFLDTEEMRVYESGSSGAPRSDASSVFFDEVSLVAGGRNEMGTATDLVEVVISTGEIESSTSPEPKWAMAAAKASTVGFLFGGFDENRGVTSDFLLFDPSTREFSVRQSEAEARAWASAVSLSDGRVLVIGGLDENGQASTSVDMFDPGNGALCRVGDLKSGRWLSSAVRLPDGRVLVMGGLVGAGPGQPTSKAEILDARFVKIDQDCSQDLDMLSSQLVPDMRIERFASIALVLSNGAVAVVGGLGRDRAPIKQIEVFIPE